MSSTQGYAAWHRTVSSGWEPLGLYNNQEKALEGLLTAPGEATEYRVLDPDGYCIAKGHLVTTRRLLPVL